MNYGSAGEIDPAEGKNCILSGNYNLADWSDMEQVLNLHNITVKSLGANAYRLGCGS